MILDGKLISSEIKEEIKKEIQVLENKSGKKPGLAVIIVGDDPASRVYVKSKIKTCNELGMESRLYELEAECQESEIIEKIKELNADKDIDGILVQLPLPKKFDESRIIDTIAVEKDVDCFTHENLGKVFLNDANSLKPCTPSGVIELLKRYGIDSKGKKVVIIGRSNIVGKPLALMFINLGATVTVCNSHTPDISHYTKEADILVAAVGKPNFITAEMVKEGAVVVDVGINRVDGKLVGDVDFSGVAQKTSFITPVPGGVGPMTIAMLLKNSLEAFKNNRGW